jgi:cytoskeletal protein RodZ
MLKLLKNLRIHLPQMILNRKRNVYYFPEEERATKLIEIGDALRQARLAKSLSLEDVASRTLVPVRLLRALEAGHLDQLPEPVYIQGFIRRYAEVMGLNGAELARQFPTGISSSSSQTQLNVAPLAQLQPLHLWILYVLLIMTSVSVLSARLNSIPGWVPEQTVLKSEGNVSKNANGTTVATGSRPTARSAAIATQPASKPQLKGVNVKVTVKEEAWIEIIADGNSIFEGTLPDGTQRTWQGKQQVTVASGNAGGVLVSVNGGAATPLGAAGAVQEKTFKASAKPTN